MKDIHLFIKYFLRIYVSGSGDTEMNKIDTRTCLLRAYRGGDKVGAIPAASAFDINQEGHRTPSSLPSRLGHQLGS